MSHADTPMHPIIEHVFAALALRAVARVAMAMYGVAELSPDTPPPKSSGSCWAPRNVRPPKRTGL